MIYVSEDELDQVQYLINQSIQGNHILFDPDEVRKTFQEEAIEFAEEEAYAIEPHIERMISQPTLAQKKEYLAQLDPETFRKVIRTYFNIVENSIYENYEAEH